MHARLGLGPAVGVVALHQDGGGLDAGLFPGALLDQLDLELPALGPARVHAEQHAGPVLGLRAARARMDLDVGVVGVGLAGQERLHLAPLGLGLQGFQLVDAFALEVGVVLGLGQFDQRDGVLEVALQARQRAQAVFELGALAHHLLRGGGVAPQRGVFGFGVEFG